MESNEQNNPLSSDERAVLDEQSVGYRYEQEVKVLDVQRNVVLVGRVTGIDSIYKILGCTEEYRKNHPEPTISVRFRTAPDTYFKDGYFRTMNFIPETKLPEYEPYRNSFRLLD